MKRLLCVGRLLTAACSLALLADSSQAAKAPVFFYDAPASATPLTVNTVIVDQSGAGNNGAVAQAALPISNDAPVGGGRSFDVSGSNGSVRSIGTQLIHNTAVAAQGGFQMEAWFKADAPGSGPFGSIINYAGTERIQLGGQNTGPGGLGDKNYVEFRISSSGDYVANPDIDISDNAWHRVVSKFIVTDMSDPRNLRGDLHLTIDDQTFISRNGLRTRQGDDLNRVISIGSHPTAGSTPAAINNNDDFDGLIYQPKVWLGFDLDPSIPAFKVEINRDSGAVVLRNLGPALQIAGYALKESRGMLTPTMAAWNSLSESSSNWLVMDQSASELAEASITTQSTLAVNGTINLGNVYQRSPFSGVTAEILLTNGTLLNGYLEYTGSAAKFGDLNFDGSITEVDYNLLSDNLFGVHTSLTGRQAYQAGDLDGDADTDEFDFLAFKNAFIADNPVGAAAAGFTIPEPASAGLTAMAMIGICSLARKRRVRLAVSALAIVVMAAPTARAELDPLLFYNAAVSGSGGVGASILDQSGKGNHGSVVVGAVATSTDVPTGLTGLSYDFGEGSGSINTLATQLLTNATIVNAGGFTMEVWVKQTAAQNTGSGSSAKIIDYAGTERLQLGGSTLPNSLGDKSKVEFRTSNTRNTTGNPMVPVNDDQWHHLVGQFRVTNGTNLADVTGNLQLTIDGVSLPEVVGGKTNQGDTLNRAIGIGNHPTFNTINSADDFDGLIYNPRVFLGTAADPIKLQINTATGAATLTYVNDAFIPALTASGRAIDMYKISSAGGHLIESNWNSLQEQGFDAGGSPSAVGDFNGDGRTDGNDFLTWQRGLNTSVPQGTGADGSGNGTIDAADLSIWKANFGAIGGGSGGPAWKEAGQASHLVLGETYLTDSSLLTSGTNLQLGNVFNTSGAQDLVFTYHLAGETTFRTGTIEYVSGAVAAVPEPAALTLVAMGAVVALVRRGRRAVATAACGLAIVSVANPSAQAKFVDRDYKLGESDPGSPGAGDQVLTSFDDAGIPNSNDLHDLTGASGVTYANVSTRPYALGSTLGAQFDGTTGFLSGTRFGNPSTTISSTLNAGPNNYSNVLNRGMQFWVNPDDVKLGDGLFQSVVADTSSHAVLISPTGTWVSRFNSVDLDTGIPVKLNDNADGSGGWHHVMMVRPFGVNLGSLGGGNRLYVDGVAVAFHNNGTYASTEMPLVIGANTNLTTASPAPGTTDFFKGVIDDLEMFVLGTSAGTPRVNYGEFNLRNDNEFIANKLAGRTPGDLTLDNVVNDTDVTQFIDNWRFEKRVNNVVVPDLTTYEKGDFNLDGRVNLLDWYILRDNHVNGASLDLAVLLNSSVPEPGSATIAIGFFASLMCAARRRLGG